MFSLLALLLNSYYLMLYIGNTSSFPPPLSPKEEQECFRRLKDGSVEAKHTLIERNLRLVAHIIKKYYSSSKDQEDLISIGTVGLIKAVNTFDSEKGTRFATYAARCIENEILMFFRSSRRQNAEVKLSDPIDSDKDGNCLSLADILSCEDNIDDQVDLKLKTQLLYEYIGKALSEREKNIVQLRYGLTGHKPMAQREVAKLLGISRSYVSRIEKKALSKLEKEFFKIGITNT